MMQDIRGLTLYQPYATGIAIEVKPDETRSWKTKYRGLLAIHAALYFPPECKDFAESEQLSRRLPDEPLPLGAIVAVVELVDVVSTTIAFYDTGPVGRLWGDYSPGRFAWKLSNVQKLENPVPCKGGQRLWRISEGLKEQLREQGVKCR